MDTIGKRLEYVKKQKGFTFSQLGEIVGITGESIRIAINRDNIKEYYLNLFSEKLEIDREWLLTGAGDWQGKKRTEENFVNDCLGYNLLEGNQENLIRTMRELIKILEQENEVLKQKVIEQQKTSN